jgi:MFS family permease
LLFLLIGGVLVDRLPRGRVMLVSDLLRGAVVSLVAAFAFARMLEVWHILIASMIFGFVDAFFGPAYTAIVPEIVASENLPSANSLTSLSRRITGIVGPALGAAIVALGGTPTAFALDAFSFFVSAMCLVPIARVWGARVVSVSANILSDMRQGFGTVFASPWLWITIVVFGFANVTLEGPMGAALPFLVKNHLHADVGMLGLLESTASLGSIIAALWLGRRVRIRRRGLMTYGAAIILGLAVLGLGLPIPLAGVMLAMLFFGLSESVIGLIWTNTLQELVPHDLLGRVASVDEFGSFVLIPVGYGVAGWATDWIGAQTVFVTCGALSVCLFVLALLHPAIRGLD